MSTDAYYAAKFQSDAPWSYPAWIASITADWPKTPSPAGCPASPRVRLPGPLGPVLGSWDKPIDVNAARTAVQQTARNVAQTFRGFNTGARTDYASVSLYPQWTVAAEELESFGWASLTSYSAKDFETSANLRRRLRWAMLDESDKIMRTGGYTRKGKTPPWMLKQATVKGINPPLCSCTPTELVLRLCGHCGLTTREPQRISGPAYSEGIGWQVP
jgi:hypothetical protein